MTRLDPAVARQAVEAVERTGSPTEAAKLLGIPRTTIRDRLAAAKALGIEPEAKAVDTTVPEVPAEVDKLKDRVFELESLLKGAKADSLDDEYVKRKIIEIKGEVSKVKSPPWLLAPPAKRNLPGVPSVMWSDWHWGEVVSGPEVNDVNRFDLGMAHQRARRLLSKTIQLLQEYEVRPEYPGIVVNLGGDMLSGDIHDELKETNEVPNMVALLDLFGVLKLMLAKLADQFGSVFVPCVTGNHGRNTKKPQAKRRNTTNFDWLLYQFLAKAFEKDPRIEFYIPDGPDAWYRVYNHRYLLTHGDQFRGGDGMIGALGPIERGHKKKQARNAAIDLGYDTMVLGHWHQYIPMLDKIVNGSLKGYDEYALANNFGFQLPIQALWTTHHMIGINSMRPVYLEDAASVGDSSEWVSWKKVA